MVAIAGYGKHKTTRRLQKMLSPDQSRMGRAAVRWTVRDLSEKSQVGVTTINRFETGQAESNPATLAALRRALEAAGVEFIDANGGGPGVRLRGNPS